MKEKKVKTFVFLRLYVPFREKNILSHWLCLVKNRLIISKDYLVITMEHGRQITQHFLGEHKVITPEQQLLGIILCFLCI